MDYIVEYGIPDAVNGANTVEDLRKYLYCSPYKGHRLVTCQNLSNGNYLLVWEKEAR